MGRNGLHAEGTAFLMAALAEGGCPQLRALSLRSNDLGPAGLTHLVAALQQGCLARLESLDLAVNAIGAEPAQALLPLLFAPALLPQLKEADLTFNGLDAPRAALQLAALRITSGGGNGGPIVKLERKSAVPIVRRPAAAPAAAPAAPQQLVVQQPQQQPAVHPLQQVVVPMAMEANGHMDMMQQP